MGPLRVRVCVLLTRRRVPRARERPRRGPPAIPPLLRRFIPLPPSPSFSWLLCAVRAEGLCDLVAEPGVVASAVGAEGLGDFVPESGVDRLLEASRPRRRDEGEEEPAEETD